MANPRQRRKNRSASHRNVSHSRRAKTLHLKKQPAIKGPALLQEAWDKTKTVRQNYATLGLAASLNPRAAGGTEKLEVNSESIERDAHASGSQSTSGMTRLVPKGFGRIFRDDNGEIIDVVEMDEDEDGDEPDIEANQGGGLVEDRASVILPEAANWVSGARQHSTAQTDIMQALEHSAAMAKPVPRSTSKGERSYLELLVAKYGTDVEAMARDRKLNTNQHTAGELSRAIRKAGNFATLVASV